MLSYMRKHSKGWMIKFILGAIILVFIAWGGSSYLQEEENKIAKIDNHIISMQQYQKAYTDTINAYQQQYGQIFNEKMIKMLGLKEKVLEQMIENYVLEQEAQKLGIVIADTDLQESLQKVPFFLTNGAFDMDKYNRFLDYLKMTPQQFEEQQRRNMIRERLYGIITENAIITQNDIEAAYREREDAYELNFIKINVEQFKNTAVPTEEELIAYFAKNKESYKIPPKIRIAYIEFSAARYAETLNISEDKLRDYYASRQSEFMTPAKAHVRHILITAPPEATEQIKKEKHELASQIAEKAKAGEDFAALAKKYSDTKATALKGGDMGWVDKDNLEPSLADAAFAMKAGDVRGPIKTPAGYQIVKLEAKTEALAKPFEEVSATILQNLKTREAKEMAYKDVDAAFKEVYESPKQDIVTYAKVKGLTLSEYGPFAERDQIALPLKPQALNEAFTLPEGELGGPLDIGTGYMFYRITSKIPARIPELKEVRDKVWADVARTKTLEAAKAHAKNLAEKSKPEELAAMNPETTGTFKRSTWAIPKLAGAMEIKNDLDSLQKPKFYVAGGEPVVVWLKSYQKADIAGLTKKEANGLRNELLRKKQEQLFDSFIKQAKKQHKIVIAKDKLS